MLLYITTCNDCHDEIDCDVIVTLCDVILTNKLLHRNVLSMNVKMRYSTIHRSEVKVNVNLDGNFDLGRFERLYVVGLRFKYKSCCTI